MLFLIYNIVIMFAVQLVAEHSLLDSYAFYVTLTGTQISHIDSVCILYLLKWAKHIRKLIVIFISFLDLI